MESLLKIGQNKIDFIGEKEMAGEQVSVRKHVEGDKGVMGMGELGEMVGREVKGM